MCVIELLWTKKSLNLAAIVMCQGGKKSSCLDPETLLIVLFDQDNYGIGERMIKIYPEMAEERSLNMRNTFQNEFVFWSKTIISMLCCFFPKKFQGEQT